MEYREYSKCNSKIDTINENIYNAQIFCKFGDSLKFIRLPAPHRHVSSPFSRPTPKSTSENLPKLTFAFSRLFWPIRTRTGKTTWQKDPRFMGRYGPISDIESGRISANRAHFRFLFHANPNGAFYWLFREGAGSEKGNPGPIWVYFLVRDRTSRDGVSGATPEPSNPARVIRARIEPGLPPGSAREVIIPQKEVIIRGPEGIFPS
jgi:hypothetical protein